jgi:hypothetical protein
MSDETIRKNNRGFYFLFFLTVLLGVLTGCGISETNTDAKPPFTTVAHQPPAAEQNLVGEWVADSNGVKLIATVQNDRISIVLQNDDTKINFWDGTFVTLAHPGDVVASIKDKNGDIMVSSAETKTFDVGDGTLTFDIAFMGVTKTIKAIHV